MREELIPIFIFVAFLTLSGLLGNQADSENRSLIPILLPHFAIDCFFIPQLHSRWISCRLVNPLE